MAVLPFLSKDVCNWSQQRMISLAVNMPIFHFSLYRPQKVVKKMLSLGRQTLKKKLFIQLFMNTELVCYSDPQCFSFKINTVPRLPSERQNQTQLQLVFGLFIGNESIFQHYLGYLGYKRITDVYGYNFHIYGRTNKGKMRSKI